MRKSRKKPIVKALKEPPTIKDVIDNTSNNPVNGHSVVGKSGSEVGIARSASGTAFPYLIPRPNGRGALLSGGKPGNKGGGSTPNELRALFRQPLARLLPVVERIAQATDVQRVTCPHCDKKLEVTSWLKAKDKLQAVDLLARYGIGTRQEVEHQGVTVIFDGDSLSV